MKDAPIECLFNAKNNGLLDKPEWKQFKRLTKREGLVERLDQQVKLPFLTAPEDM